MFSGVFLLDGCLLSKSLPGSGKPAFAAASRRLARGPLAVGAVSDLVSRPILGKNGLAEGSLIANWAAIVGESVAKQTMPEQLRFSKGTRANGELLIRAASGPVALKLDHDRLFILDTINRYFGYQAVARIKIIQAPLPLPPRSSRVAPPRKLSHQEEEELNDLLDDVTDPELRAILDRLGRHVVARSSDT